ncbi:MAG: PQQ-like beta-propeller repeat protein [Deltaproteobacteria bacterium]|nr:PQQ-like beta-propeller repeat protein [Deltaproteobacteria bacterium]
MESPQTGIVITATFEALSPPLDQLRIRITRGDKPGSELSATAAEKMPRSPHRILALFAAPAAQTALSVSVEGLQGGTLAARGDGQTTLVAGEFAALTIALTKPCSDTCPAGDTQCVGDQLRTCARDALGCLSWTVPTPCPLDSPYCSAGRCSASCTDECTATERRCAPDDSTRYLSCGQFDSDTCRDLSPPTSCGAGERCRQSDGACIVQCDGKDCLCQAGDTQPCSDVGRCQGGVRHCEAGSFGPCRWTTGPQAETCNGVDDDCDTKTDEANELVAPACGEQRGVCAGAVKRCGGQSGWLDCTAADYAAHAKALGQVYEAEETLCDGKDNDCDGTVDEAPGCCKPDCSAKPCGADDSCGGKCQSGPCADSNATCINGACSCLFQSCSSTCCAQGATCHNSACCQASCAGKACGADDGCGGKCPSGSCADPNASCQAGSCACLYQSCGSLCCPDGDVCQNGACVHAPICAAPITIAVAGELAGDEISLAIDSKGKRHISCRDNAGKYLKYVTDSSGTWQAIAVDTGGTVGLYSSLRLDTQDNVHISYYDLTNHDLKYATNASGKWVTQPIDQQGSVGSHTSLALDTNDKLHIIYAGGGLRYATNASGSWVSTAVLAGTDGSLALDANGKPHVGYTLTWDGGLRYATNAGGWWAPEIIDSDADYPDPSTAFDAVGKLHIAYQNSQLHALNYATNASGKWVKSPIDQQGDVGYFPSLALDAQGRVHISYLDSTVAKDGDLKYATNASGKWVAVPVDRTGDVGLYSSLAFDGQGKVHIAYYDRGNKRLKIVVLCP